jgi:hypothetical protein
MSKLNPATLQGHTILAVGGNNLSIFTNQEFVLGSIIFQKHDGVFFEIISFENSEWIPFFRFENNSIELSNANVCKIIVNKYNIYT